MTLIVEDGSNVANANSFADIETIRLYAVEHGHDLPAFDSDLEKLILKGSSYLNTREDEFIGCITYNDQTMCWPRKYVYSETDYDLVLTSGRTILMNEIPSILINALGEIVVAQYLEIPLYPVAPDADERPGTFASEETIGPIITKFKERTGGSDRVSKMPTVIPAVEAILKPLLSSAMRTTPWSIRV